MRYVSKFLLGIYLFFYYGWILFKLSFNLPNSSLILTAMSISSLFSTFLLKIQTVLRRDHLITLIVFSFWGAFECQFQRDFSFF